MDDRLMFTTYDEDEVIDLLNPHHGNTPHHSSPFTKPTEPDTVHIPNHSEMLKFKQALGIIAVILISTLILSAAFKCLFKLKRDQFSNINVPDKILCTLFLIAFFMFSTNTVIFINFIFNINDLSATSYAIHLVLTFMSYRIGHLCMGMFFIFRLYFLFSQCSSSLTLKKPVLIGLISMLLLGTILGCISAIVGPFNLIQYDPQRSDYIHQSLVIAYNSLGITLFVEVVIMVIYIRKLKGIIVKQAEIAYKQASRPLIATEDEAKDNGNANGHDNINGINGIDDDEHKDDEKEEQLQLHRHQQVVEMEGPGLTAENKQLIASITQSTLLCMIGISTSMWLHLVMLMVGLGKDSDGTLFRAIASFDGAVNLICMYLVFTFAKKYYSVGCHVCHIVMEKCCIMSTRRAVLRAKRPKRRKEKKKKVKKFKKELRMKELKLAKQSKKAKQSKQKSKRFKQKNNRLIDRE